MKKERINLLRIEKLKGGLREEDAKKIDGFFRALDDNTDLPPVYEDVIFEHYADAFEYYLEEGRSVAEILSLLDLSILGDYYVRNKRDCYTLDNAAIVYPLGMTYGQMPMFRLSVTLKEDVVPSLLQIALYETIRRFPVFSAIVKTGFFWHYLETSNTPPLLEEERDVPCKPISIVLRSSRSFRVFYYRKRISIEFFHVLTDGSGGMVFLKTLLSQYFHLLGRDIPVTEGILDITEDVKEEETVNEFERAEGEGDFGTFIDKKSLQLNGKLSRVNPSRIIHFDMDSKVLVDKAHEYNGTLTAYITAVMMEAAQKCIKEKEGPVQIQVPVNMRKFNGSKTLRNYSMYFNVAIDQKDHYGRKELVELMASQIKERGSQKIMNQMMKITGKLIRMVSHVPVFLKTPVIQIVYGYLGNSIIAGTLSNLGVIEVPEEMEDLIDHFDFLFSPGRPNRMSSTLISYRDRTRFTITKATNDKRFEEEVYRLLTEDGIDVRVEGSVDYES